MNKSKENLDFDFELKIPQEGKQTRATFVVASVGAIALKCTWSYVNKSDNTSDVTATLTIEASADGYCRSGSHLTIGSSRKEYSNYLNSPSSATNFTLVTNSTNIAHNSSGVGSVRISGALVWNGYMWHPNGGQTFNTLSGYSDVSLGTIEVTPPTPSAPTNVKVSGYYEKGEQQTVSWTASSGATEYYVSHKVRSHGGSWSDWYGSGSTTSTSYTLGHGGPGSENRFEIIYGVRARTVKNGNASSWSAYTESPVSQHFGIRTNQNGWKWGKIHVYDNGWKPAKIRVWDGSKWVTT